MKPASLLRWYPRAWRERYGQELLALIQDTLDAGERPGWRLRLGVAWGGVRERVHQARRAGRAEVKRLAASGRLSTVFWAGGLCAVLPRNLAQPLPAARGWQAVAARDAILATVALTGAMMLARGLLALPALVRFLRAGGWPNIRRRVAWAAGGATVAGGVLAALIADSGSYSSASSDISSAALVWLLVAAVVITIAVGVVAAAAADIAEQLTLAPRVRTARLMLGAVIPSTGTSVFTALAFWWSVTQTPAWLAVALVNLVLGGMSAWVYLRVAARQRRKLRAAGRAGTVNPSAGREHGRHRA